MQFAKQPQVKKSLAVTRSQTWQPVTGRDKCCRQPGTRSSKIFIQAITCRCPVNGKTCHAWVTSCVTCQVSPVTLAGPGFWDVRVLSGER